jgi:hypothetical protein
VLLLLAKVWPILLPQDEAHAIAPEIPLPSVMLQVYAVLAAVLVKAILVAVPLQIVWLEGVAVITGIGLTVTTAVAVAEQPVPRLPVMV